MFPFVAEKYIKCCVYMNVIQRCSNLRSFQFCKNQNCLAGYLFTSHFYQSNASPPECGNVHMGNLTLIIKLPSGSASALQVNGTWSKIVLSIRDRSRDLLFVHGSHIITIRNRCRMTNCPSHPAPNVAICNGNAKSTPKKTRFLFGNHHDSFNIKAFSSS